MKMGSNPNPDQGQPNEQPSEPSGEGGGEEGEMWFLLCVGIVLFSAKGCQH